PPADAQDNTDKENKREDFPEQIYVPWTSLSNEVQSPLTNQNLSSVQGLSEFRGLQFADFEHQGSANLPVDILIGIDYYHIFMTGEVIRSKDGPVASSTKVGWVMSGRLGSASSDMHCLETYLLRTTVEHVDEGNDSRLNLRLTFWDVENVGPSTDYVTSKFEENIMHNGEVYPHNKFSSYKRPPYLDDFRRNNCQRTRICFFIGVTWDRRVASKPESSNKPTSVTEPKEIVNSIVQELLDENQTKEDGKESVDVTNHDVSTQCCINVRTLVNDETQTNESFTTNYCLSSDSQPPPANINTHLSDHNYYADHQHFFDNPAVEQAAEQAMEKQKDVLTEIDS
ncbi:Hypothetical predicted protein, partial [Paramuricea clavata]